jgi:hypothetical protein
MIMHNTAVLDSAGSWDGLEYNMAGDLWPQVAITCSSVNTREKWAETTGSGCFKAL